MDHLLSASLPRVRAMPRKIVGAGRAVRLLTLTRLASPGDPGREVTVSGTLVVLDCSEPDFDGVEMVNIDLSECAAGDAAQRGHNIMTHPTGEKTFVVYEGTTRAASRPGGSLRATFEGDWWYVGGTGRFVGIVGGGTYAGHVTPAGPAYTFEGEYVLGEDRSGSLPPRCV